MIKQSLNSVITKNRDLSASRESIVCQSRRPNDLLTTDKSRYFAQPFPIIVNYEGLDRDNSLNMNMMISAEHSSNNGKNYVTKKTLWYGISLNTAKKNLSRLKLSS